MRGKDVIVFMIRCSINNNGLKKPLVRQLTHFLQAVSVGALSLS